MKKCLLAAFLLCSFTVMTAQEKVTGSRKQLIREILQLRKEVGDLRSIVNQNDISLSDTTIVNDSIHYGALSYLDDNDMILPELNTDSLLSIFYLQRSLNGNEQDGIIELDSLCLDANLPDSVYIRRLTDLNSFITLPYNYIVRNHIVYYTQKMPEKIATILGLASYYMPIFEEIFDQNDMPLELKVMAIIESALNPTAVSRAKARGMWQFMYRTGLQYDLKITSYVDERYDPIVSGHAAARYLKDAYTIFGDWALAIAAYNCGAGNVNKAIRRAGGSREFWNIYPYLPRETRGYVPSFVAALYTLTYYREHGIRPYKIEMPAHIDTFHVSQRVHFEQIAECTGISVDELRDLNPQYLHDIIPGPPYLLRLPHSYTSAFAEKERQIYAYKDSVYFNPINQQGISLPAISERNQIVHNVRSGENLGSISRRYGVKVSDLQYWNNLKGTNIRVGQRLMVYSGQAPARSTASASASSSKASASSSDKLTHTVKSGENLGLIAQKYNVSVSNLQSWNGIKTTIYPGQKLTVYANGASSSASTDNARGTSADTGSATYQWHTVKRGETLWGIAQNYEVSLNDLLEINGLNKNSKIIAGKKLKVKKI